MKEEIYLWMKNLAVFYILFTAVLQLVPDQKYQRYIRSFLGLLLIYMLSTPVFAVFGQKGGMTEEFSRAFQEEIRILEQLEEKELQGFYLTEGYQQEAADKIAEILQKKGINPSGTAVQIEGEAVSVELTFSQTLSEEQEGGIRDVLRENFGIAEKNCKFLYEGDDRKTVDGSAGSGTASYGDRTSGEGGR